MPAPIIVDHPGINWGQVIATGVAVLTGLSIITAGLSRWLERYRQRNAEAMRDVAKDFADTLGERLGDVENHLQTQDSTAQDTRHRLWRIEQMIMNGRRRWFGRRSDPPPKE